MSNQPSSHERRDLLEALADAEQSAGQLRGQAQELTEWATYAEGVASRLSGVIRVLPEEATLPAEYMRDLTDGWRAQSKVAKEALFKVSGALPSSSATTAAATLTTSSSMEVISAWMPKAREVEELRSYLVRPTLFDRVRSLAVKFGLDTAHSGTRSPVQLLDEASLALRRPAADSPGPTAVLLPAREAIESALASLLRRRPRQEATRNTTAKVVSIGTQCGALGLGLDHFERLGHDVHRVIDQLSHAKGRSLQPPEVVHLFNESLQVFEALLTSLDGLKLKSA